MRVSALYIYPVKSCRGIAIETGIVDTLGLRGDRRFMFVDKEGKLLTQRTQPKLTLVETSLSADELQLSRPGAGPLRIPLAGRSAPLRSVEVWGQSGLLAEDCGEAVHTWISDFLGESYWLVRIGAAFRRPVKSSVATTNDLVSFADAYPLLGISEASLHDLNDRLAQRDEPPVPMNRFRPNVVISGVKAFEEDTWKQVKIGSLTFRSGGPCSRCIIPTIDQLTAERGKEPLRTLAIYRRDAADPSTIYFGQNLINEDKSGQIRVGDEILPLPSPVI